MYHSFSRGTIAGQTAEYTDGNNMYKLQHACLLIRQLPFLQVSRNSNNACMLADSEQIRLQQHVQTRSLTHRQGESAFHYVRIFKILEIVHELLQSNRQATQRDLYYRLLYPPIFCTTKVHMITVYYSVPSTKTCSFS